MSRFNELIRRVQTHVEEQGLFQPGGRYIVALSGGADSTFLLHAMLRLSVEQDLSLVAASLNHGLRPDAGKDLELVRRQAIAANIPFHAGLIPSSTWGNQTVSPETAARAIRLQFLRSLCAAYDADAIVTGHNRTDHVETLLMNIHRGTGIRGMAGLLDGELVIRPLLTVGRDEIRGVLDEADIPFREDPSNRDTRMMRNRVRGHLLEPLQRVFGDGYESAWVGLSGRMRDSRLALVRLLEDRFGPVMQSMEGAVRFLRERYPTDSEVVQHELVLWLTEQITGSTFRMNRSLVDQIARFLRKDGYAMFRPFRDDTLLIVRSGRWITWMSDQREDCAMTVPGEGVFPLWFGSLCVGRGFIPGDARPDRWIDPLHFPFPWRLAPVREGDVIQAGGKSVNAWQFMKKAGVGAFERNCEPVLKSGETVLLVPDIAHNEPVSGHGSSRSIPVYMDRPMGYNPRRLQKADPIGSDHPKEARER